MIVAADSAMVTFQFQDARTRKEEIIKAWGPIPELSLLRAVVYGRGVHLSSASNVPAEKKITYPLQAPRRKQAVDILA